MYCKVIVPVPVEKDFIYKCPENVNIKVGSVVLIPFGNKAEKIGLVFEIVQDHKVTIELRKIKKIIRSLDNIVLKKSLVKFISWVSNYNLYSKGMIFKMIIPNKKIIDFSKKNNLEYLNIKSSKIILNSEQKTAFKIIKKFLINKPKTILLEGVTGSGKTEVFFKSIDFILKSDLQVLILLPEISLTPQIEKRFIKHFGFHPDIWHSKISESKKRKIWQNCFLGKAKIIIGARSSLFLPYKNLGLIIVDEEHDNSYKQEDGVRYHARDMAIVRSSIESIPIILSSATPSIETYNNAIKKKYEHVFLSKQYSGYELPRITLIDLNKNKLKNNKWISDQIIEKINLSLKNKEQSLLFLNRRGYSPLILCGECGYKYKCDNCSSWLVLHNKKNILLCHHCGFSKSIKKVCIKCKSDNSLKYIGPGIERVAEEIKNKFPKAKIETMSSDSLNTTKKINIMINRIEEKKIDILVGTQIIAKGYHFPNLSFVGVIDADAGLRGGDLRASENTFNLLQQVGGRAGRTKSIGEVYIQTYFNENKIIKSLQKRDREFFLKETLNERKKFNLPPFGSLVALIFSGSNQITISNFIKNVINNLPKDKNIIVLGPIEAPIFLLRGKYRFRLLLKGQNKRDLNNYVSKLLTKSIQNNQVMITVDVDPYSFM